MATPSFMRTSTCTEIAKTSMNTDVNKYNKAIAFNKNEHWSLKTYFMNFKEPSFVVISLLTETRHRVKHTYPVF